VLANSTAPPVLSNQERPQLAGHRGCNHRHTHDEDHRHLGDAEYDPHNHAPYEDSYIEHVHHGDHSHHRHHNHSDKNDHVHGDHEHFYGYHRDAGSADGEEEAEWRPYPLQLTQLIICSSKLTKVKASMSQMKEITEQKTNTLSPLMLRLFIILFQNIYLPLWLPRRKIRLIESNAKCRHLKKIYL
jgi:hypothetical protein